jgi:hypothetical protein
VCVLCVWKGVEKVMSVCVVCVERGGEGESNTLQQATNTPVDASGVSGTKMSCWMLAGPGVIWDVGIEHGE